MGSFLGATAYGESPAPGGGSFQRYQRGRISWSPTTGAHALTGPLLEKYLQLGAEAGSLGYPVSDEQDGVVSSGPFKRIGSRAERRVVFQRGILSYSPGRPVAVLPRQPAAAPPPAPPPSPSPSPVVTEPPVPASPTAPPPPPTPAPPPPTPAP
jgi:hypothetical protein